MSAEAQLAVKVSTETKIEGYYDMPYRAAPGQTLDRLEAS